MNAPAHTNSTWCEKKFTGGVSDELYLVSAEHALGAGAPTDPLFRAPGA